MKPRARQKARRLVLQGLYERHFSQNPLTDIEALTHTRHDMAKVDTEFFHELLHGIIKQQAELDALFEPLLDRDIDDLTPIELYVIRIGCYELKNRLDVPYRVAINESVELAKIFGADQGHKYVNSILDKLAKELRKTEINANQ